MLHSLSTVIGRRARLVLGAWLALLLVSLPFAAGQASHLVPGSAAAGNSQSARVEATLRKQFPQLSRENTYILFAPTKHATGADMASEITRIANAVHNVRGVELTTHDRELALFSAELVSPVVIPLRVAGNLGTVETVGKELQKKLRLGQTNSRRVDTYLIGEGALWTGLQTSIKQDLTKAELIGVPLLLVVLCIIFGSLSAAALPVALGIGTVVVTGMVIYVLSTLVQLSVFITDTASLMGLGVAVDYSLIILARVREELAANEGDLERAQSIAMQTSGRAVIFSGATVTLAICGLLLIPDVRLRSMALGAALAVTIAVGFAITALPAMMCAIGSERLTADRFHLWFRRTASRVGISESGLGWVLVSTRRPVLTAICACGVLLTAAIPALSIRMGTGALQQLSAHSETRVGFEKAAKISGPGALGPIYVVVGGGAPASENAASEQMRRTAAAMNGVKEVHAATASQNKRYETFSVIPASDPEETNAKNLVGQLRRTAAAAARTTGTGIEVGGVTATQVDQEAQITHNMWKVVAVVLLLSLVILTALLRSIVLPVKAIVMNLLTVAATYGVLVAVFQWGWLDGVLGVHHLSHLETITPPLVLAIVFGLSMDYEIFLLSRIREQWQLTGDARKAVANGLAASAPTISGAALLLVCVFAVFAGTGIVSIKEIGIGGAVAITIDVTIVRLVLVPALMTLFGRWNWWWPKQLDRIWPGSPIMEVAGTVTDEA
jgi:uncharacterized membrane protein YdfJ with MMPL/SSD domain